LIRNNKKQQETTQSNPMQFTKTHSLLLILALFAVLFGLRFTKSFNNALSWDTKGYYLYLPAAFIYNDAGIRNIDWVEEIQEKYGTTATLYFLNRQEFGDHVIKYTGGLAFLYSPFFFLGHGIALILPGVPADGFSLPYQYAVSLGMFILVFGALWFLRLILHRFFDDKTVLITLFLLVAGTNLVHQFTFGTLMSHTPLVFLFSLLIWSAIRFYDGLGEEQARPLPGHGFSLSLPQGETRRWLLAMAFVAGLISLIRPTEVVVLILVFLWGAGSWKSVKRRFTFFVRRPLWLLVFFGIMALVALPQLVYWKTLTGQWLYYSYDNAGEGMDFLCPHTLKFLFSFRKGWLIYTPLMAFALYGLVFLYKKNRGLFLPVGLFFVVSLYLMSSWTTWWYAGGCFSSRAMISVYPALSIPLGYFVEWMLQQRKALRSVLFAVAGLLVLLNMFQTWQFNKGIITQETMTRAYYFRSFLRTNVSSEDRELLMVRRPLTALEKFEDEASYRQRLLFRKDFRQEDYPDFAFSDTVPRQDGSPSLVLDSLRSFSPTYEMAFRDLTEGDHAWLRARARIYLPEGYTGPDPLLVVTFTHKGDSYKYRTSENYKIELEAGKWNLIAFDYITPEVRRRSDRLMVYLWHRGRQAVFLESVQVDIYEPGS
jgi:hypothetical protein